MPRIRGLPALIYPHHSHRISLPKEPPYTINRPSIRWSFPTSRPGNERKEGRQVGRYRALHIPRTFHGNFGPHLATRSDRRLQRLNPVRRLMRIPGGEE